MKILMPIDGSDYTKRMLSYVAAHEELLGPGHSYTLLTVVAGIPAHAARFLERGTLDAYYAEEAERILEPVCAFARQHGWNADIQRLHGHAADEIARVATTGGYDLVVMGSHGHSALGGVVLGSVASGVLARCRTPVLLVR
jgi:nucleotide-binding universal stress UspA family protein